MNVLGYASVSPETLRLDRTAGPPLVKPINPNKTKKKPHLENHDGSCHTDSLSEIFFSMFSIYLHVLHL